MVGANSLFLFILVYQQFTHHVNIRNPDVEIRVIMDPMDNDKSDISDPDTKRHPPASVEEIVELLVPTTPPEEHDAAWEVEAPVLVARIRQDRECLRTMARSAALAALAMARRRAATKRAWLEREEIDGHGRIEREKIVSWLRRRLADPDHLALALMIEQMEHHEVRCLEIGDFGRCEFPVYHVDGPLGSRRHRAGTHTWSARPITVARDRDPKASHLSMRAPHSCTMPSTWDDDLEISIEDPVMIRCKSVSFYGRCERHAAHVESGLCHSIFDGDLTWATEDGVKRCVIQDCQCGCHP